MGFRLPAWRKVRAADHSVGPDDVLWGVRRKMDCDGVDDPWAHRGITQHAYYLGHDTTALCGYQPFRWRRSQPVPLAAATELNPPCPTCLAAVGFVATATPGAPMIVPVSILDSRRELLWPEPMWPEPIAIPIVAGLPGRKSVRRARSRKAARKAAA